MREIEIFITAGVESNDILARNKAKERHGTD